MDLHIRRSLDDQLPSMSGVHGLKDFLCSAHLHGSFDGRIYSYGSVLKSKFVHQRIHEDEHYRDNPSNHELLTVRGVDCRASKKMFWGVIPVCSNFDIDVNNTQWRFSLLKHLCLKIFIDSQFWGSFLTKPPVSQSFWDKCPIFRSRDCV